MNKESSNDWNPTLAPGEHTDLIRLGLDRLIGRCESDFFSLECDTDLVTAVLSCLTSRPSLDQLAQTLGMPRSLLEPLIQILLDGKLAKVVHPNERRLKPYIDSAIVIGDGLLFGELVRAIELARLSIPIYTMNPVSNEMHRLPPFDEHPPMEKSAAVSWGNLETTLTALPRPMLVSAPSDATLERLLEINECCVRTQTPWLPLYYDGATVRVGPTVIPNKAPCFGCLLERLAFDHQILFPEFPPRSAFNCLREAWPIPEGEANVAGLRLVPLGVNDIAILSRGDALPELIGRQCFVDVSAYGSFNPGVVTFEMNSRCPSCHGNVCADLAPNGAEQLEPAPFSSNLSSRPVLHADGGLRTVAPRQARQLIERALGQFGTTIHVKRCTHGPLGHLPAFRSFSEGYLDRNLLYMVPRELHTGKGITEEQAYLSAAYEMAERISSHYHMQKHLVQARPSEVEGEAIHLPRCLGDRYLDVPGYDRIEDDVLVDWVWGESLVTGRAVLLPASMVFFPQQRFRGIFKPQWSGGLSAGASLPDAILHGMLERVEHDGWAVWQLNRAKCPRVDERSVADEEVQAWLESVKRAGFDVIIRDKRTDLNVPAFRVWILNRRIPQAFACRGDGANMDPVIALKRAMTEAQHKLAFSDSLAWQQVVLRPTAQLMDDERSLYYLSGLAEFELADDEPDIGFDQIGSLSKHEVAGDIETLVARIISAVPEADIVVVDLTDLRLQIPTVRVLAVGLQEMAKPWMYLLPRVFDLPVRMGKRAKPLQYHELYLGPFPH